MHSLVKKVILSDFFIEAYRLIRFSQTNNLYFLDVHERVCVCLCLFDVCCFITLFMVTGCICMCLFLLTLVFYVFACLLECVHAPVFVCVSVCVCVCVHVQCVFVHMPLLACVCVCVFVCGHTCLVY